MPARPEVVSFLSDYGLEDEFVGVCKGVMLSLAPGLRVIDLSHEINAHDVRAGALALVRAAQYVPDGIVLAVVDPGVGTDRRAVAVEVDEGYFLGPDNGLLAPAVAMLGGARRVVALTNPDYQLPTPAPTFAGRDVFAPAVGYLANGVELEELGELVDPAGLVPGLVSLPQQEDGAIAGEVWWVDRFGNCQLNVDPGELTALGAREGDRVEVRMADRTRVARWAHTFADAKPSELLMLVDSSGLLSLVLNRASAASELELRTGAAVTLVPPPSGGVA